MKSTFSGVMMVITAAALAQGCATRPQRASDGKTVKEPGMAEQKLQEKKAKRFYFFSALVAKPSGGITYLRSEPSGTPSNGEIQLNLKPGTQDFGALWCACPSGGSCPPTRPLGAIKHQCSTVTHWTFKLSSNVQAYDIPPFQVAPNERRIYELDLRQ